MESLLLLAAPIFALAGFFSMAVGLFMSKRYTARRPRSLFAGAMMLVFSALCYWLGQGGAQDAGEESQVVITYSAYESALI